MLWPARHQRDAGRAAVRGLACAIAAMALVLPRTSVPAEVIFYGQPVKKVTTTYKSSEAEALSASKASEFAVTITSEGGRFYWASRENTPLVRTESGAYITYLAANGSGYVRIYQPFMYEMMSQLPPDQRAKEIGYVEHLVHEFGSVTYYGDKQ